jgi:transposase InsO family protein
VADLAGVRAGPARYPGESQTQIQGDNGLAAQPAGGGESDCARLRAGGTGRSVATDITYIATDEQAPLTADDMHSSMSRKADCRDNAPTESLWGSLKRARLHGRRFETMQAAQWEVMDWLTLYNATRLHSTLGYVSPMQHERNRLAAQEKKSA